MAENPLIGECTTLSLGIYNNNEHKRSLSRGCSTSRRISAATISSLSNTN